MVSSLVMVVPAGPGREPAGSRWLVGEVLGKFLGELPEQVAGCLHRQCQDLVGDGPVAAGFARVLATGAVLEGAVLVGPGQGEEVTGCWRLPWEVVAIDHY